jgi:2-polyprenyl-3-methyl-5-hydroxy-6-metoxy-1,4-benzoquinol methylase
MHADGSLHTVLDFGCGRITPLKVPPEVSLIGVDVDEEAVSANESLDERIVADIQCDLSSRIVPRSIDAALCWNVLEHLQDPERAIENVARSLRPKAILAVGTPNPFSLKGVLTKLTPYGFHRWAYRKLLGSPLTPHPTVMRLEIAPRALPSLCKRYGLELEHYELRAGNVHERLPLLFRIGWILTDSLLTVLSVGRYDPGLSEAFFLFRKA